MPQLIAITTAGHYTDAQRAGLKADIEQQMSGFDVHVLILPPGAQIQQGWVAPVTVNLMPVPSQVEAPSGFLAACGTDPALAARTVQHVDTDEQEEPAGVLPPHVWLYRKMLTDLQALAPLGVDTTNGQVAVAIDQLTPEQRKIPHIEGQMLFGADVNMLMKNNT